MNQLVQEAFAKAAGLPEAEQDRIARFLLAELESERQWGELFARTESEDLLERLADDAPPEHRAGRPRPLTVEDYRHGDEQVMLSPQVPDVVLVEERLVGYKNEAVRLGLGD